MVVFSAIVLADRAIAVGASLTSVTVSVKAWVMVKVASALSVALTSTA